MTDPESSSGRAPHPGARPDYRHPVTISWFQIDTQGVVFNMWYLGWCDDAYAGFLEHAEMPYRTLLERGLDAQLVHVEIDYARSLVIDDRVEIVVSCERVGTSSFVMCFAFQAEGVAEPAALVRTTYVLVDTEAHRPVPVPEDLRARLLR